MEEKDLDVMAFSNVDAAALDKDHVYVFRVKQEYLDGASKETAEEMCRLLGESLKKLDVKYIIVFGDVFDIKEIVR